MVLFFVTQNFGCNGGGGADTSPLDPPQICAFSASLTHSPSAAVVSWSSDFFLAIGLGVLDSSSAWLTDLAVEAVLMAAFSLFLPVIFFLFPLCF